MAAAWPELPYDAWRETRDTIHMHSQVLGKLAVVLAPPEPQLQHTALRLTARGFETKPLPEPDGSGAFVAALDLHRHQVALEHSDGRERRIPLTPNRSVADVTRDVVAAAGVKINPAPQETTWTTPLDEDTEHATYDEGHVAAYLAAATQAALVLAAFRAPYRGRATQVNAWWGSFDLAVNLFSGRPADPPSQDFIMRNSMDAQDIAVGWWPGDARYPRAAFYAYAHPAPDGLAEAPLEPASARWDGTMGLFLLDWDDALAEPDPHAAALGFARSVARHTCVVCDWDPAVAASLDGKPPPVA